MIRLLTLALWAEGGHIYILANTNEAWRGLLQKPIKSKHKTS